ncbi:MAG: M55 family metallopeptidase [archaeon GB-1867-005]|nr:M55 family metallopeptidase [Candidatus Culexmicrobium cathedralense]
MKAFISVDLEGMPYIVSPEHLTLRRALYDEARKIATKITKIAAESLKERGFDEIIVADSHGPMVNLLVEELPDYVEIVRGYPRPLSMVAWIQECNAAIFLGYHAKAGTAKSTFDHTYSGTTIAKVEINGIEVSEFLLNAYVAGHYDIPVILVGGEAKLLEDDVAKHAPWAERVVFKRSASRYAAISPSMAKIKKALRDAVSKAVLKFNKGEAKPLKTNYPVNVAITFLKSSFADAAELLPGVKRIGGLTAKYEANDILEAYKVFELLVLAASAVNVMTQPK